MCLGFTSPLVMKTANHARDSSNLGPLKSHFLYLPRTFWSWLILTTNQCPRPVPTTSSTASVNVSNVYWAVGNSKSVIGQMAWLLYTILPWVTLQIGERTQFGKHKHVCFWCAMSDLQRLTSSPSDLWIAFLHKTETLLFIPGVLISMGCMNDYRSLCFKAPKRGGESMVDFWKIFSMWKKHPFPFALIASSLQGQNEKVFILQLSVGMCEFQTNQSFLPCSWSSSLLTAF